MKLLRLIPFLLFALPAFAAGGACPSGANYLDTTNHPSGTPPPLVTLSTLGITNGCYFIAATGLDTNNGTSESTPWAHMPGMSTCTSACATVQTAISNHAVNGIGFIFHGGDTWHFVSSATPNTGGSINWNGPNIYGAAANPIYIGVDTGWPSSGWTRPAFSGDNTSFCNQASCPGGSCGVTGNGILDCYVLTCSNPLPSGFFLFNFGNLRYIIVDNFEVRDMCQNDSANSFTGEFSYGAGGDNNPGMVFERTYVHGWTHQQWFNPQAPTENSGSAWTASHNYSAVTDTTFGVGTVVVPTASNAGGYSFTITSCSGTCTSGGTQPTWTQTIGATQSPVDGTITWRNTNTAITNDLKVFNGGNLESILFNIVDGNDSDFRALGVCYCGFYRVAYNYFTHVNSVGSVMRAFHTLHDNVFDYITDDGHSNIAESSGENAANNVMYNNVGSSWATTFGRSGMVGTWVSPGGGLTDYMFNNIQWAVGGIENNNIGENSGSSGTWYFFNNTIDTDVSQSEFGNNTPNAYTFVDTNNHLIDAQSPYGDGDSGPSKRTTTTPLQQTNSVATAAGYTSSQSFIFSPISSGSPTIGHGTNLQSLCTTLKGSSDLDTKAAGTACQSDTTYACKYAGSGGALTCPARTPILHAASAAWSIGAYEFSASTGPGFTYSPNPVAFGSVNDGTSSSPITVTITNNGSSGTLNIGTLGSPSDVEYAVSSNTCNSQNIVVNGTCTFVVTFSPTSVGSKPATISVPDNVGNPDTINLTGTGVATGPIVSLSPTTLAFGNQQIGTTSPGLTTTLTNAGNATLNITSIVPNNAQYAIASNTCGSTLTATSRCSVNVTFTPTTGGSQNFSLIFTTNASTSPDSVALTGSGSFFQYQSTGCSTIGNPSGATNAVSVTCTPAAANDSLEIYMSCHASSGTPTSVTASASPSTGWSFYESPSRLVGTGSGLVGAVFSTIVPNTTATTFTFTFAGVADCSNLTTEMSEEETGNSTAGGATTFNAFGSGSTLTGSSCSDATAAITPPLNNEAIVFFCQDNESEATNGYTTGVSANGDISEHLFNIGEAGVSQAPSYGGTGGGYIVMGLAIAPAGTSGPPLPAAPAFNMLIGENHEKSSSDSVRSNTR